MLDGSDEQVMTIQGQGFFWWLFGTGNEPGVTSEGTQGLGIPATLTKPSTQGGSISPRWTGLDLVHRLTCDVMRNVIPRPKLLEVISKGLGWDPNANSNYLGLRAKPT